MYQKIKKIFILLLLYAAAGSFMVTKLNAQGSNKLNFSLPGDLLALEKQINNNEKSTPRIRQGCEAKIVWTTVQKETEKFLKGI